MPSAASNLAQCFLHVLLLCAWPLPSIAKDLCLSGARCRQPHPAGRPTLSDELLENFIVVPEHRLLFCFVEKVGCANFNEFFRRLRSRYDLAQAEGPPWYKNTPEVHGINKTQLEDILADRTWHKAVFWRDPVERFVSAFLSKCGHADQDRPLCWAQGGGPLDQDGEDNCFDQFGVETLPITEAIAFVGNSDFDRRPGGIPDDMAYNRHWKRMGRFCGGLAETLHHYDTVEELDIRTSNAKTSALLQKVGVDAQSVAGFDDLFPRNMEFHMSKDVEAFLAQVGVNSGDGESTDAFLVPEVSSKGLWRQTGDAYQLAHNTDSANKLVALLPLKEHWLRKILIRHYSPDYRLFNIPKPPHPVAALRLPGSRPLERARMLQRKSWQQQPQQQRQQQQQQQDSIKWPLLDFKWKPWK